METGEAGMAKTLLRRDPLFLAQIMLARARVVLFSVPHQCVESKIGNITFEFDFSDKTLLDSFQHSQPAMHAMRFGSYEPTLRRTMRRLLKPGDTFIDVGANIGYISAVAASIVGPTGQIHSFEPTRHCFLRLQRLAQLNPDYRFYLNNFALGAADGEATITLKRGNIGGNTLLADQIPLEHVADSYVVPVKPLSAYLADHAIERPAFIKIDVEGFEYQVIQGMSAYFQSTTYRPPIVCEVTADAAEVSGSTLRGMADHMRALGYTAYRLVDNKTPVDLTTIQGFPNLLFTATNR